MGHTQEGFETRMESLLEAVAESEAAYDAALEGWGLDRTAIEHVAAGRTLAGDARRSLLARAKRDEAQWWEEFPLPLVPTTRNGGGAAPAHAIRI